MYTNINTEDDIESLTAFLKNQYNKMKFKYSANTLIDAIKSIMKNNRMKFGDVIVKQIKGIEMGMSPAPTIANLFVAIHDDKELLNFLRTCLLLLQRFIEDGLDIWLHDQYPAKYEENRKLFKTAVNAGGITWTFTPRLDQVDFMDMTLKIVNRKIETLCLPNQWPFTCTSLPTPITPL